MAAAKQCDRCGKYFSSDEKFVTKEEVYDAETGETREEEVCWNSFRVGDYNPFKKEWAHVASGNDMCNDCASKTRDFFTLGEAERVKIRKPKKKKPFEKVKTDRRKGKMEAIEAEQGEFAEIQAEGQSDGSN